MRAWSGLFGFVGGVTSLAFWVIVPLTVSNSYIHSGQEGIYGVLITLSLCALVGSMLIRVHAGWASLLMGLGVIPGVAALLVPGLLLAIAALIALESAEVGTQRLGGRHAARLGKHVAHGLGSSTLVAGTVSRVDDVMRSDFVRPHPIDMPLAGRTGGIVICRLSDGAEVGTCQGPNHAGKCPRPLDDGTVPCAGSALVLPLLIRGSREWHIPAGYRACFMGSYDVYRQPQQARAAVSR